MRTLIFVTVLLFPLMSGITSVIMADPTISEPATAVSHDIGMTTVAMRLE